MDTRSPVVLLVDHAYPQAWQEIRAAIEAPVFEGGGDPFYASVEFIQDPAYDGMGPREILGRLDGYQHSFAVLVDRAALTAPGHPVLIVGVTPDVRGRTFRALPTTVQAIENNLSIANMDFEEFASSVGPDGIFRGF